jgi:hypothetical protein
MRPIRVRFAIRWLMETTAIVAIALWLLRSSAATWFLIFYSLTLYVWGLAPLRRLHGFAPLRRLFGGWTHGHLPVDPEDRTKDGPRM